MEVLHKRAQDGELKDQLRLKHQGHKAGMRIALID